MSSHRKLVLIITFSQAVCLVFALWMQSVGERVSVQAIQDNSAETTGEHEDIAIAAFRVGTVIWLTGIQFGINWVVVSKILKPANNQFQQQQEDSLLAINELVRTRDAIIFGLAKLAESRDPDTGQHLERISLYSVRLATALRRHPKFRETVTSEFVRMIGISSVLHDIGKVGVEDAILLKSGLLDEEERDKIRLHAEIGSECIHQIERRLGNTDFLSMAHDIALCHHERWDGQGYPQQITELEIPLAARIVAICDVYDALASKRVYKDAVPHIECVIEIEANAGTHFDPHLVDVFLSIHEQFEDIAGRFRDFNSARADHISSARGGSFVPSENV